MTTACASVHRAPRDRTQGASTRATWRYEFDLDRDLDHLRAAVCFETAPPRHLVSARDDARAHLEQFAWSDRAGEHPLRLDADGIVLDGVRAPGCVRYVARLGTTVGALGDDGARITGATPGLVASSFAWLWFPDSYAPDVVANARVRAPDGLFVSVPWTHRDDGTFALDTTAFEREGYLAASSIPLAHRAVAGATLEIVSLGAPFEAIAAPWLVASAETVSQLFRGFPAANAQLMLFAQRGSPGAVHFAFTSHASGESVLFFVDPAATADALARDSTALHEFVHLGQPVVRDTDTWISEGIATYYETVLRVRAGRLAERDAWQLLEEGFDRGRSDRSGRTLGEDSAALHRTHRYGRVYWAGVAYALLSDVALRRASAGAQSLDDAVRGLAACCRARGRTFSALEVATAMDRVTHRTLLAPRAARMADAVDFPDLAPTETALGVRVREGQVTLDDTAPDASLRRALFVTDLPR